LRDLLRTLFVPLAEQDLVMVQENEELAALGQHGDDQPKRP
jgi:hypothetical protein